MTGDKNQQPYEILLAASTLGWLWHDSSPNLTPSAMVSVTGPRV